MYNDSEGSEDDERSSSSEEWVLRQIKENDPDTTILDCIHITHLTDEELEELGRDIANNTHLKHAYLWEDALNDRKASFLFRGLTRSASITIMHFNENGLSVAGVRSMVPFLQNANNLHHLYLDNNNIQSEGFNELFRALRYSPVEALSCDSCGIESIDVDNDYFPRHLTYLNLNSNVIDADGCHGIAKLMQGGDSTLKNLWLNNNKINDEGVGILVDALQNNTSLTALSLSENYGISKHGMTILLKLVNDISSIEATLGSNHTLSNIFLSTMQAKSNADKEFETHIDMASDINRKYKDELETAGREKVIQTQLHSARRAKLADLQGVNHLVYSEINPLHLPEVLSLVGRRHGHGELYVALKSSIAGVISTVNRKEFIRQQRDYHLAKAEQLNAELAAIEAAEGDTVHVGNESHSNKRRRK